MNDAMKDAINRVPPERHGILNPIKVGKPDGGPAFPTKSYSVDREVMVREEGMTLRDYFAAKALQGMLSDHTFNHASDGYAQRAYKIADAMLEARK